MTIRELINSLEGELRLGTSEDTVVMIMDQSSGNGFEPVDQVINTTLSMVERVVLI